MQENNWLNYKLMLFDHLTKIWSETRYKSRIEGNKFKYTFWVG